MNSPQFVRTFVVFVLTGIVTSSSQADNTKGHPIALADGKVSLTVPSEWTKKQPRVRIIDYEFALPKIEGDIHDGRMTVMGATGSVQRNVNRWMGQFRGPEPKTFENNNTINEMRIAGQMVHVVDISGTFLDRKLPFENPTARDDYRMLGAIIQTDKLGTYFCKCYGPKKTIAKYEKFFSEMLMSLIVTD